MPQAFWSGALAGYAIAIPVGAIAVLILETSLQRGFWHGFAAGSGTATADLFYATIAVTVGTFVASFLTPIAPLLRVVSAGFLVLLGIWGLRNAWRLWRSGNLNEVKTSPRSIPQTYATFLGLTILNPATIAYFAALILGGTVGTTPSAPEKAAFVLGAFLASWSWQSLLAVGGALAHRHMPPSFRLWTSFIGNTIIILLGIKILF